MKFSQEFLPLELDDLRREAAYMKADGWRFVQTHCVASDDGVDIYYSFMKDGDLRNYRINGVQKDTPVPSITDMFLAAFVFENEARELFGVNMGPIAIDFEGTMYNTFDAPMTFLTPEQKAARDKARKAAAEKSATAGAAKQGIGENTPGGPGIGVEPAGSRRRFQMTPELQARLDAKLPTMSPEKVAKVEAALARLQSEPTDIPLSANEARMDANEAGEELQNPTKLEKAEDEAFKAVCSVEGSDCADLPIDKDLAAKLDGMDPAKAQRVREALEGRDPAPAGGTVGSSPSDMIADEEMEKLLAMMDSDKAAKVIAAFSQKEGE